MSSAQVRDGRLEVPVIDISSFRMPYEDADARDKVVRAVAQAGRTVGFMQITGHGIQRHILDALTGAMDAFFALDAEIKETKGRYRRASAVDLFEAFNVGAGPAEPGQFPGAVCAASEYPAEVPGFEAAVTAWFDAARTVARTMVTIFGAALGGRKDYLTAFTDHSADMLRMNNYRLPDPGTELAPDQLGMGAHTDYGIVTVMWADAVPGLEIYGGDEAWHPVMPAPGALLVNPGDALARWTNDEWISALHRVVPPRRADGTLVPRRSAAFFHDGAINPNMTREAARLQPIP